MFGMTETHLKGFCSFSRSNQAAKFVAGTARRNLAAIYFCLWSMATKADGMSVKPGGYRKSDTTSVLSMTGNTGCPRRQMSCVINLHIETTQARKSFDDPCSYVRVTNAANRTIGIAELLRVAAGTGRMARFSR
jgi:hypothetical protein